jgi:antitoxin component YwqK of YwqJK toxin-antitoxin module
MKKLILLLFIQLVSCQDVEVRKTYYDSGELQSTVNYVDDLRQGEWKEYYKSGELEYTSNYVDGDLIQGQLKEYYDSGVLASTENYVDGLRQ